MDLSSRYLGLNLKNPLVASAGPLTRDLDALRHLEEAGVAAVVLNSLFEEQVLHEERALDHFLAAGTESFAEALSYFPEADDYARGPDEYLEYVRKAKASLSVPVIASLNGVSSGGWMEYARKIQEAGADALELNVYYVAADPSKSGAEVEALYLEDLKAVKSTVSIPVAVKLAPYFSSIGHLAKQLDAGGANGLVLFNRFYQPDIDLDELEVVPDIVLSSAADMRLPLRWIAILYGRVKADLAATSGIFKAEDVLKMVMAGASATCVCSALLIHGVKRATEILKGVERWMEDHEYESLSQMKGSLSQQKCPQPAAFERANYMKALQNYK